ncbi:MAG: DegT/DnrJ/EryC1/StrS family aminotransferase [Planctomycetaceae bacterium]
MSHSANGDELLSRRTFLKTSAATATVASGLFPAERVLASSGEPAVLGGTPIVRGGWPGWPIVDEIEQQALRQVLESGNWYRYAAGEASRVAEFEQVWANDVGTAHCQATSSGTSALVTALAALDVGPGDEVLVPPYTFVATINAVLVHHALPVFVDSDPETALMDPDQIEQHINGNTRAILPVHVAGAPCAMDRILDIARRHNLKVIEDACQAHTAAWKGKRVGSIGDAGCFSFQNSKNITSGEGGAVTTGDATLYANAQAYQNNGSGRQQDDGVRTSNGANLRLTEFQGALLLAQLERQAELTQRREQNGALLNTLLEAVPGVRAKRTYEGTTRHGYHLYMLDYDPDQFAGMSKSRFLQAVGAEGVPISGGYTALNRQPFIEQFLSSRGFGRIYSPQRLNEYREQNQCPANDRMIATTCWLPQTALLGTGEQMQSIADAFARVQQYAGKIAKTG